MHGRVEPHAAQPIVLSRIARMPVPVPAGVHITKQENQLLVKGPKGQLSLSLHPFVTVHIAEQEVRLQLATLPSKAITGKRVQLCRSIVGTMRAHIKNMVHGVTSGFEIKLLLVGVGFRAQLKERELVLSLGYSHPTQITIPEGMSIEVPIPTELIVKGIDKESVGQLAATIRKMRVPDAYKGKGVRYAHEIIELKDAKK